jgi:hypothetical protein
MNRTRAFTVSTVLAMVAAGFAAGASAYTGADPVRASGIASCTYTDIKARIDQFGNVSYKVYGLCAGSAVSGQMAYKDGEFHESFIANNAKISTSGYCDTDPWATAVNCHDQKVQSSGAFEPGLLKGAPLSLISGNYQGFRDAFLNASRPNPPGLPVNFTATADLGQVTARWLAPDTSGDRPFIGFILQARPKKAEGAAWVDVGLIFAHAQPAYRMKKPLPATSAAIPAWDVRLCSTTNLASTCTPALSPGSGWVPGVAEVNDNSTAYALAAAQPTSVRVAGRVRVEGASAAPSMSICDSARAARARNSPAAPGLEAQCRAAGAAGEAVVDVDALAARGEGIANQDPLAVELREMQPDDSSRRGYDIGMAAAEGQTGPGPGKDRIRDSLPAGEKQGFIAAVAFSLERNRNAQRAAKGAEIAASDPVVDEARNAQTDVFYRLGFDIATGIFGDPGLGAQGNTAPGPGSMGVRDALSPAAREGFNASMALHLSRDYAP